MTRCQKPSRASCHPSASAAGSNVGRLGEPRLQRMVDVALQPDEGFTSPLGVCESAESRARPLFDRDTDEGQRQALGAGNHWQCRQHDKSAEQSVAELNAALNLL